MWFSVSCLGDTNYVTINIYKYISGKDLRGEKGSNIYEGSPNQFTSFLIQIHQRRNERKKKNGLKKKESGGVIQRNKKG